MSVHAITPRLDARSAVPYVSIPVKASLREWTKATALAGEVLEWLLQNDLTPAGAPCFRYRTTGNLDTALELEVGSPVESALAGDSRVRPGQVPAGTCLVWQHHGHPDKVDIVHDRVQAWARDEGVELMRLCGVCSAIETYGARRR